MEIQDRAEFKHDLASLLASEGWRYVVKQSLTERCVRIQDRLAKDKRLQIEQVRELQTQYLMLREILDEPFRFFMGNESE